MDWARQGAQWPHRDASRFVLCKPHRWHVQDMGAGPTVILIHGAGGATQSFRHLAPLLAQSYRVVMMDLPGQGFTKCGAIGRCGLDDMANDLLALIRAEGWDPSALIGHSAGAAIALRMAEMMQPAPAIVGVNAALANFAGVAGVLFPLMAKALAAMPFVADLFTASNARPASVRRLITGTGSRLPDAEIAHYLTLVGDRGHVNATLQMMAQWDLNPLISRLGQHPSRTLLLTGDRDKAVPPKTSARVAAQMPDATHQMLTGLGHLAHEEDAAAVAAPIIAFLRGVNSGPQGA